MATKTATRWKIPIIHHKKRDKTRAHVAGAINPETLKMEPEPGAEIVEVTADTSAAAFAELNKRVLPNDTRPLRGKSKIRFFRQEE